MHKFSYNWKLSEAVFSKDKGKVFSCFACGGNIAPDFNSQKSSILENKLNISPKVDTRKKHKLETFIYLMYNPNNGFYKIGHSNNPEYREYTLSAQEPEIKTLHYFKGLKKIESKLHQLFSEKRVRGEWFSLNQNDVDYIKSLSDNCDL